MGGKKLILAVGGLLVFGFLVVGLLSRAALVRLSRSAGPSSAGIMTVPVPRASAGLAAETQYRQQVAELFTGWGSGPPQGRDFSQLAQGLFNVTVPSRYKTLHLDVVIALDLLQRGRADPPGSAWTEGVKRWQNILAAEPWIARPPSAQPATPVASP